MSEMLLQRAASIEPMQLVPPDGQVRGETALHEYIDARLARELYRGTVLARSLDDAAYNLQRQGELGLWLSCRGQEAAQVGSVLALRASDHVFPAYREHAVALARGLTPAEIVAQWRGVTNGGWDPAVHRYHLNTLVLATQTLHATGYALGVKADGADEVVLVYVGDGATSQGDFNEALNWAATTKAPVLFFCQNNQWAISTPAGAQCANALHQRAAGFGLATAFVDGNDACAVYATTRDLADSVRGGGGPAFIEALTYRIAGHSTSDDPRRYRRPEELAHWEGLDPIDRLHSLLVSQEWATTSFFEGLAQEAADLAEETRSACRALSDPDLVDTFKGTLVEETELLRAEREQYVRFRESFA